MSNELAINHDTLTGQQLVFTATEWSEHNGSTQAGKSKNISINYENNYVSFAPQHKSIAFIFIYCIQKSTDEDSSHYGQAYNTSFTNHSLYPVRYWHNRKMFETKMRDVYTHASFHIMTYAKPT